MRLSGLTTQDSSFERLQNQESQIPHEKKTFDVDARVKLLTYTLVHSGPADNYRPQIHLQGEILGIHPADGSEEVFPYEVEEIVYPSGLAPRFDAVYDFSDEQISTMVERGYFSEDFSLNPHVSRENDRLLFPLNDVDFYIIAPDPEAGVPVFWIDFSQMGTLQFDEHTSGYDFVEVIPEKSHEPVVEEALEELMVDQAKDLVFDDVDPELDAEIDEHRVSESQAMVDEAEHRDVESVVNLPLHPEAVVPDHRKVYEQEIGNLFADLNPQKTSSPSEDVTVVNAAVDQLIEERVGSSWSEETSEDSLSVEKPDTIFEFPSADRSSLETYHGQDLEPASEPAADDEGYESSF